MLVSHRKKFIYTKTRKTAGTSIEAYFEAYCVPNGAWSASEARSETVTEAGIIGCRGAGSTVSCTYWNHMPAVEIKALIGTEVWDGYFKFCAVRNPFEKMVSAYYFADRSGHYPDRETDLDEDRRRFEAWLPSGITATFDRDLYAIDGRPCLDAYIRHEHLHADLERLCTRLDVPWHVSELPGYKTHLRPPNAKSGALYSDNSRRLVENAFGLELEMFSYSFPAEGCPGVLPGAT